MRRAKIVATLGPALDDRERLRAAVEAGLDVVRLNFSHGDAATHARRLDMVRDLAAKLRRNVGALADLQGPKIRLGELPEQGVPIHTGGEVFLVPGREELDEYLSEGQAALPVVYEALAHDVQPGALVLIDDGAIRLVVSRVERDGLWARVVSGGVALSRKGVNLPGVPVAAPSMTPKDHEDLVAAVEMGADWIALSFVREPEDVISARKQIHEAGGECPVIAKLERPEAIMALAEIVEASDAVMVARGDLGVEIGPERVPALQKEIIAEANGAGKPVITATEMLESMISSPRATRAEASDVANAVFDGTDALMLSGETAAGRYPVEAVRTMARIIEVAETSPAYHRPAPEARAERGVSRVVAQAAVTVAQDVNAVALVVYSISGASIQLVSKYRPGMPLLGLTPKESAMRRTSLMWGTRAEVVPMKDAAIDLTTAAERSVTSSRLAGHGDLIVIVSGKPGREAGTNRVMVHRVGDPIAG